MGWHHGGVPGCVITGGVKVIPKASLQQMKTFDSCLCWSLLNNFSDEGISMRKAQTCRSEIKFNRFTQRLLLLIEGSAFPGLM